MVTEPEMNEAFESGAVANKSSRDVVDELFCRWRIGEVARRVCFAAESRGCCRAYSRCRQWCGMWTTQVVFRICCHALSCQTFQKWGRVLSLHNLAASQVNLQETFDFG